MLPYWLLFFLFAAAALRFGLSAPAGPAATAGSGAATGNQPTQYHWERLGQHTSLLPVAALVPALMIGLRYGVGTDWGAYVTIFKDIARSDLGTALFRIDPGYAALNWIASELGAGIWLVNIACGLLFMFGLTRFARAQPNPWLAIVVAVPYLIIGVGMGYSRQAVAIALCMAGLASLSAGAPFSRFVFWVLAGALFHRTAVILIPIVALGYTRNRLHTVFIGLLGCAAGYYVLTLGQGLEHFRGAYVSRVYESQGAVVRLAMNLPPSLIYLAASRRFTADETERRIWRNFAIIALASFLGYFFIASSAPLDRMALYIIPLQLFVFARLPNVISQDGRPTPFFVVCVVVYSALVQLVWLEFSNNSKNWIPYRVYFTDS